MGPTSDDMRRELHKGLEELRQARDEVRLQLHLLGMDARARWEALEPRFSEAEERVRSATDTATEATRNAVNDAIDAFRAFRASLGERPAADAPKPPQLPADKS